MSPNVTLLRPSSPPPSFPISSPDHSLLYHTTPLPSHSSPPLSFIPYPTNDLFLTSDLSIDLALDDDTLTTLDKIYLLTTSKSSSHRVFIAHALPSLLRQVTPHDAIQYVLPLLSDLAIDQDEQVKETLATQIVPLIWWFFTHCQLVPEEQLRTDLPSSDVAAISGQAFTPILGTFLLSANPVVAGAARYAIVDILTRLKNVDEKELASNSYLCRSDQAEDEIEWAPGLFRRGEREMFRNEILHQIVIGIARLDVDIEDPCNQNSGTYQWNDNNTAMVTTPEQRVSQDKNLGPQQTQKIPQAVGETVNPYLPVIAHRPSIPTLDGLEESTAPPSRTCSSGHFHLSSTIGYPSNSVTSGSKSVAETITTSSKQPEFEPYSPLITAPRPIHTDSPSLRSLNQESWSSSDFALANTASGPHVTHGNGVGESESDGQAAVGRLSSLSLIAAVTASGSLDEGIKKVFAKEIERVGRDPVYWVRREVSFALGALAKVVPEEIVICSFLPLFDSLRRDSVWHVRLSALFALPAILSRLPSAQRHFLALDTIITLSMDESPAVRSGVLEALGEVLYSFRQDDEGPPEKLLQLFLGRQEDKRLCDGQQAFTDQYFLQVNNNVSKESPLESVFNNSERHLICAFNYPAVAYTLGRDRWPQLREVYLDIATNRALKVRQTLAASLGVLAKIVGKENAQRDLVGVWWDAIVCEDNEVRIKAVESLDLFVSVLGHETGDTILQGLISVWDEGILNNWREREGITKSLTSLIQSTSVQAHTLVVSLLNKALEDVVAGVREEAVSALPHIWSHLSSRQPQEALTQLKGDLRNLARSTMYRRRMTFLACQQALVTANDDGEATIGLDDEFWISISNLVDDTIIGVRIGLARLVGVLSSLY